MSLEESHLQAARRFQQALLDACLVEAEDRSTLPVLWTTYRQLVRARLRETLEHAFERLVGLLGEDAFDNLVADFLASAPPRAVILRMVPLEFIAFIEAREQRGHALPPWAIDLARFEWAELEVAYAEDDVDALPLDDLEIEGCIVVSRACRLLDLAHEVHRVSRDTVDTAIAPRPSTICVYRDPVTFDAKTLELTAPAAALVREAEVPGGTTFADCVKKAAAATSGTVDGAWLEALAVLTVDLGVRGILKRSFVDGSSVVQQGQSGEDR